MSYPEILQTISTVTGTAGFIYMAFIAKRLHGAVNQQTDDLKKAVKEQTEQLKNGR